MYGIGNVVKGYNIIQKIVASLGKRKIHFF